LTKLWTIDYSRKLARVLFS